jgi:hypothetical protein
MYEKASSKGRIILAMRNFVRKLVQLRVHHSVSFVPFFFQRWLLRERKGSTQIKKNQTWRLELKQWEKQYSLTTMTV